MSTGGYSTVAAVLNADLDWPDGRTVSRQQIEAWHTRRTANKAGQLPPSAIDKRIEAARTYPVWIFETEDWVLWVLPGVPDRPPALGWVFPTRKLVTQ
jgi:hypothetical protein